MSADVGAVSAEAGVSESFQGKSVAMLRRFVQRPAVQESCELCAVSVAAQHRHLLEAATNRIVCSCNPCALRFEGIIDGRFKLIPRDARRLRDFQITDAEWESLALPINLVFIVQNSRSGKMKALYPSPGGATESLLSFDNWSALIAKNPVLASLQPDVEALLINRVSEAREYFIAPIDVCFELVGIIRTHWRGFSGGSTVWDEVGNFFARLTESSREEKSATEEAVHG